jgi:hypothetical protein
MLLLLRKRIMYISIILAGIWSSLPGSTGESDRNVLLFFVRFLSLQLKAEI